MTSLAPSIIVLLVLAGIAVIAGAATLVVTLRDGYGHIPTRWAAERRDEGR